MLKFNGVSIIIPAVNETVSLRKTVKIILESCKKEDLCEFVIVLGKISSEECVKTAKEIEKNYTEIPVKIYYQKKPFIGAAISEAFEFVKGSHVVMMSSDLETPPEAISEFINLSKQYPDKIITASRWIKGGGFKGYSKPKWIANYIFQKMLSLIFCVKYTDLTYAYRIFPTELVQKIKWEEVKHPFFLETALKPLRLGVDMKEIPVFWSTRTEGESQNSFFKNFAYFKTAYKIRFMSKNKILKDT